MAWIEIIKVQTQRKTEIFYRDLKLMINDVKEGNPGSFTDLYLNTLSTQEFAVLIFSKEMLDDKTGSPEALVISEYLRSVGHIHYSIWKQFE